MKIRILDPGFANMTGLLGTVEFVDGVSVEEVSSAEAARLGTILSIEIVGTGVNPSITQLMVDTHNKNLDELGLTQPGLLEPQPEAPVKELAPESPSVSAEDQHAAPALSWSFTEEELDALVKKEGIAGLRAFSEQYGINGQSIAKIVKALLEAKAEQAPVKQVEPEAEAPVAEEAPVVEEAPVAEEVVETTESVEPQPEITQVPGFVGESETAVVDGEEVLLADETPVAEEDHSDMAELDALEEELAELEETKE